MLEHNLTDLNIHITHDLRKEVDVFIGNSNYSQIVIIVDENTKEHCLPIVSPLFPTAKVIEIESGELNKHLGTCTHIWQQMTDLKLDRKALVVDLGGGVIGDMGGFCASTYKRGIDFIQIPTTLLSQVDASVGGKLGVDFNNFKNHIGVFQEPKAVFISTEFLQTLDPREIRSGFAEIIKHCLIADGEKWLSLIKNGWKNQDWNDLVNHSIQVKAFVVTEDPTEKGLRKILNFGHTIGHAIESFYLETDKRLFHGEAIAIGMIAEAYVAHLKGFLSLETVETIKKYIIQNFDQPIIPTSDFDQIIPLVLQDKKNEGSSVMCTLLKKIGEANFNQVISFEEIREGILYYNK